MQVAIFQDYHTLSAEAASRIIELVKRNPEATLCLAAGDTPRLAYSIVVEKAREGNIDFTACTFIGLDEWVGIPPSNPGSCHHFLETNLFSPMNIRPSHIHLFDALSADLVSECRRADNIIRNKGGIDLMLVGVGMNGHIGFNEPGVPVTNYAHVVNLDKTTRSVGQKYFTQTTPLHQGITLGLQHFLESREAILIASGTKKARVVRQSLEGPVSTDVPASIIQHHPRAIAMLDEDAAMELRKSTS